MEFDPGRSLLVLWRLRVDGELRQVVVSLGRMAERRDARKGHGAGDPAVQVSWFPDDPGLPLLGGGLEAVARRLQLPAEGEPELLAWMPQQRATLRFGDVVFKLYADGAEAAAAVRAHAACVGWLPTPAPLGADPTVGVTAQLAVPGRPLGRDDAVHVAERAGRAIRRLHDAPLGELRHEDPGALLELCRAAVGRVAMALPAIASRLARATDILAASLPVGLARVPSHGDYTVGQMIEDDGRLWIVDTDTLCAAPPAHDLAAYAANLISGRAGDPADAHRALERIIAGYGPTPPQIDWYLAAAVMRRVDRPLRRLKKHWPERTENILAAVEELLPH